jgi:two-component system, OmpR family, sensor kinase
VTLRTRLLLALAYVLLLAVVAFEVPLAINLSERVDGEVRSQARGQADVVAASASELLREPRRAELGGLVARAARSVRGRVLVVDARGRALADSAGPGTRGRDYASRPELAAALAGRTVQERRRSETLDEELLATATPIERDGRRIGAVRITQSVDAVGRAVGRSLAGLVGIGVVVLALGLGVGALVASQVTRPLRRLEAAARGIAAGDLSVRAPVEGSREQRELARAFNEMTARLARLVRSQRDFVADASHQLRTPLTGLRLRLEEARAAEDRDEAAAEIDAGLRELDRLAATVEELLELSRAGERERAGEEVDLAAAARRAAERWAPAAEARGIELATRTNGVPARVLASEDDVDRALDALVENAVAYSGAGALVEVVAQRGELAVVDEGPGLAPGEEERVLERFHRGSAAARAGKPGTGLGLAIAGELARCWGGSVRISNREDRPGARASIALPPVGEKGS